MKTRLTYLILLWASIGYSQTVSTLNQNIILPYGIASDDAGNFFVSDATNNAIVKFTSINNSSKPVVNLGLNTPRAITIKGGIIYIVDSGSGVILKFQEPGTVTPLGYGYLSSPRGVAVDNSGNVYVITGSNVLRMTGTGGNITTLIGSLNSPEGIAIDSSSNFIYITCGDGTVKKANINGTGITTFASGLSSPSGIVVDWSGNVFVAEYFGGAVKKITPAGVVSNFATGLQGPNQIAINNNTGNIYVTEAYTNEVKIISPSGVITTVKRFHNPSGIVSDSSGNIHLLDTSPANVVKKMNSSAEGINALEFGLNSPYGIAYRSNTNMIFVADTFNNRVSNYNATTGLSGSLWIDGGPLNRPYALAVDNQYIYIANTENNTILKYTESVFHSTIGNSNDFYLPRGIAVDNLGNLYVADTGHQAIKRMTTTGSNITTIATGFTFPTGVLVDSSGKIYVADRGNINDGKIVVLNSSGAVLHTITTGLLMPYSITFDSNGDVLITDVGDNKIKKLNVASLSVTEFLNENEVTIYPNPTTDSIYIKNQENLQITSIKIFDLNGREILNRNEQINEKIDVSLQSKGLYMLVIKTEKGIENIKFLKN
jgi:large repetitive protein